MKSINIIVIILILFGCWKEDISIDLKTNDKGEIISLPYLWKIPIHENGDRSNHNSFLNNNMVFGNKVIIPRTKNSESRMLTMIDSKDGSIVWNWDEWYQPKTETAQFRHKIVFEKYLHWTNGSRRYTIDILTGKTALRHRNENLRSFSERYQSSGSQLFLLSRINNEKGFLTNAVFLGNILTPSYNKILEHPWSEDTVGVENRVRAIDYCLPYYKNGVDYFVIIAAQPYAPNWYYDQRVSLYNWTVGEWVYSDVIAAKPKQNNSGWIKIQEDKVYFSAGEEILCYDILEGSRIWGRKFPHDFTFSGFEIEDDIMVANCENTRSYGIDIKDGSIIWESEGSGTSSKLNNRIMDGIVYFDGGGPAFLFAKDIRTGETLWKLDPYEFEESNAYWSNNVNVIPGENGEKGKVVVLSGRYAYCFEAIR